MNSLTSLNSKTKQTLSNDARETQATTLVLVGSGACFLVGMISPLNKISISEFEEKHYSVFVR